MSETEREKKALEQTGSDEREDQHENEILDIIRSRKSPRVIHDELEDYHENDIASALPDLDAKERAGTVLADDSRRCPQEQQVIEKTGMA